MRLFLMTMLLALGAAGFRGDSALLAAPSTSEEPATKPNGGLVTSRVLQDEFRAVLKEVANSTRPSPGPATRAGRVDPITLEQWRDRAPRLLEVTNEQEAAFDRGAFDDVAGKRRVGGAEKILRDFKFDLPTVTANLLSQHWSRPLVGARLELLARLLEQSIQELKEAIGSSGPKN